MWPHLRGSRQQRARYPKEIPLRQLPLATDLPASAAEVPGRRSPEGLVWKVWFVVAGIDMP